MFKNIDLFTKRSTQITLTFMLFATLDTYFHIPHKVWFIITGAMIYVGFHPWLVHRRAYMRLTGTLVGVAAVIIVSTVIHFNFRFAIIILFFSVLTLVFFIDLPYNRFMISMTIFIDLIIEWGNTEQFFLEYYITDRIICTLLAFGVCIIIEYLWFGTESMTELYYQYLSKKLRKELKSFYLLANSNRLTKAEIFKKINSTARQINELRQLINEHINQHGCTRFFAEESEAISAIIVKEFRQIVSLFYLTKSKSNNIKLNSIRSELEDSLNLPLESLLKSHRVDKT